MRSKGQMSLYGKNESFIGSDFNQCYCTECYPMNHRIGTDEPNKYNLCIKKASLLCSAHQVPVKGCTICESKGVHIININKDK